ncbi:MAG: response regulator transcription factor [Acidobacteria bacterium]|nr:response regulator transcription factor [Acidobacteriota bacterium]
MSTRVFLIDDHSILREGLRLLVDSQSDMQVIGEIANGREAADAIERAGGADVIVLDVSMPDLNGHHVAVELRASQPTAKIVVLTRHSEKAYVQQMLQSGASAYVLKQTEASALLTAIRTVANGGTYLDPGVATNRLSANAQPIRGESSADLTARELEVLSMVAHGHTNKEIGGLLGITVKTVETHKTNGLQKLEITSRAELVRFALAQGWLRRQ